MLWRKAPSEKKNVLIPLIIITVGYVIYMFTIDVPLYMTSFLADQGAGTQYLSFSEGFKDAATHWVVTFSYEDWEHKMSWMALYFSLIVWMTILLVHMTRMKEENK